MKLTLGALQLFVAPVVTVADNSILPIARVLLALGALLAFSWVAKADSIVSGSLSFTCDGGCFTGYFASTAPTGSFSYYKSTQTLSIAVLFDGLNFVFPSLPQAYYQAIVGQGPSFEKYEAYCFASTIAPQTICDNGSAFELYLVGKNGVDEASVDYGTPVLPIGPSTYPYDEATGTVSDPPVRTPEPAVYVLLACGLLLAWLGKAQARNISEVDCNNGNS
jgi:hypothetical protein